MNYKLMYEYENTSINTIPVNNTINTDNTCNNTNCANNNTRNNTNNNINTNPCSLLTKREREVLLLIIKGYNNIKISRELFISTDTAKTHVKSIVNKLNVENRIQAAVLAVRLGVEDKLMDE